MIIGPHSLNFKITVAFFMNNILLFTIRAEEKIFLSCCKVI